MKETALARRRAEEPMEQTIVIGGRALAAHRSGALYWPEERTLIVADLHFEKGSAFATRGQMLPPYDTRATLRELETVIAFYRPATLIALGDSFHDSAGCDRLIEDDRIRLSRLQRRMSWIWVSGNHDPAGDPRLGGAFADALEIGGIALRHEPGCARGQPEIAGHLHPVARLSWNGASVRRKCFASAPARIVMPAFGAFTGGLNLISEPFSTLFAGRPSRVDMLSASGIHPVPPGALIAD